MKPFVIFFDGTRKDAAVSCFKVVAIVAVVVVIRLCCVGLSRNFSICRHGHCFFKSVCGAR